MTALSRRRFVLASMGAAWANTGCQTADDTTHISGGFTGISHARGHLLRDGKAWPAPATTRHTDVLIAGGGVAGLAAARALRLRGRDDFALLELEDSAGGNSRADALGGMACPLGAHYLPLPGDDAPEVQDLLQELGLRQRVAGRWAYDERHLCHSPQERLFFEGEWQDGLLPVQGVPPSTLAQYARFADLVDQARRAAQWTLPAQNMPLAPVQQVLAAITFSTYLNQQELTDPHLRWYLDYCCRDDYGAGIGTVSAWAGIHYFASRHGFHAPGQGGVEREAVFTWPEGNAWLTRRLALPLGERLHTGRVVLRIEQVKHGVEVNAFHAASQTVERWVARRVIVALPVMVAARVVRNAPDFLQQAAQRVVYAPWLVANIQLSAALHDPPGAPPSWDNVLYGSRGLGYVDAMHQSLQSVPGATVLTHYRALGDGLGGRTQLMDRPWAAWRDEILAELALAHPDIRAKTSRIDITRYGHAMAVPVPQNNGQIGLKPPSNRLTLLLKTKRPVLSWERMTFAHSDWAGYSVFEEAFTIGHSAGRWLA